MKDKKRMVATMDVLAVVAILALVVVKEPAQVDVVELVVAVALPIAVDVVVLVQVHVGGTTNEFLQRFF